MEMRDEPEMLDIDAVYTDASDTFDEDWLGLENNAFMVMTNIERGA
jgi:hypothetical protein